MRGWPFIVSLKELAKVYLLEHLADGASYCDNELSMDASDSAQTFSQID